MTEASGIRVRPAVAEDLAAVLDLYAQPDFDAGRVLFARFARYPDYTLYVADCDGRIVGSFALLVMDNLGHCGAPSAIVEDVVVAAQSQGKGIGKAMMAFARERCREKGCYKLVLSSNAKRESAHAFYESLGFARHGYSFRLDLGSP